MFILVFDIVNWTPIAGDFSAQRSSTIMLTTHCRLMQISGCVMRAHDHKSYLLEITYIEVMAKQIGLPWADFDLDDGYLI